MKSRISELVPRQYGSCARNPDRRRLSNFSPYHHHEYRRKLTLRLGLGHSSDHVQETLFGRTVPPQERLRQHQRSLAKAQRELDRERSKLEQSEKKLVMDIKKSAKAGQMVCSKIPRLFSLLMDMYRMHVRLWLRISSVRAGTSRSSTRCALNYRLSDCGYRPSEVTNKWPMLCVVPPEYVQRHSIPQLFLISPTFRQ